MMPTRTLDAMLGWLIVALLASAALGGCGGTVVQMVKPSLANLVAEKVPASEWLTVTDAQGDPLVRLRCSGTLAAQECERFVAAGLSVDAGVVIDPPFLAPLKVRLLGHAELVDDVECASVSVEVSAPVLGTRGASAGDAACE